MNIPLKNTRRLIGSIHLILIIGVITMAMCATQPQRAIGATLPAGDEAKVIRVVSADTLEVSIHQIGFTIGLLGVNAPKAGECYAKQGYAFVNKLLRGKVIHVVRDQSDFDASGRLLRYAYLPDGRLLNEVVIQAGYAKAAPSSIDMQWQANLQQAEQRAQQSKAGLWKACATTSSTPAPTSTPASAPALAPTTTNSTVDTCPTFAVDTVAARGALAEPLKALPDGACVILIGAGGGGKYIWHPAGSPIRNDRNLLIRWQDGEMSLSLQPDGAWMASFMNLQVVGSQGAVVILNNGQTVYNLIHMGDANQFLGIGRTFLLLDQGNNQLVTLVDAFQWDSGDFFRPRGGPCTYNAATRQCPYQAHWEVAK